MKYNGIGAAFAYADRKAYGYIAVFAVLFFLVSASKVTATPANDVNVGTFTHGEFSAWKERSFKGHTTYQLLENESPMALQARCKNTASALYRKISVDLTRTPFLRWSWRIDAAHPQLREKTEAGDDYAARIYVVLIPDTLMPWRTKAIDYVWANNHPIGSAWPNVFTDQAMMVALRSGSPTAPKTWVDEARNVREDYKTFFGVDITRINGVALMTDCDNSGLPSTGYYRNIRFTAE